MGQIHLENMEFYSYHGHYEEEQKIGNKYRVSLTLEVNLEKASMTDKLEDTINYRVVYDMVRNEMKNPSRLLEHIAQRIIDAVYRHFPIVGPITVKVSKLNPPIDGLMDCVSVTLKK